MSETGQERSSMYTAKYDPAAILLRLKALQNWSIDRIPTPAWQAYIVDEVLQEWIKQANLAYGQRGSLFDLTREIVWDWQNLTQAQIEAYHNRWLDKGLTEELWQQIAALNNLITSVHSFWNSQNISVEYEVDVFPHPEEAVIPQQEELLTSFEIFPFPTEPYVQAAWRQQGLSYASVDYMYTWTETMTDLKVNLATAATTTPTMFWDASAQIKALITEPFQNDLQYTLPIATEYETQSGALKTKSKTVQVATAKSQVTLASIYRERTINISYEYQVT